MWPFGRKRRENSIVTLRDGIRGLAALTVRPTFGMPETEDGAPPKEMRLLVAGVNRTQKGDFLFDEQAAADVMAAWAENGVDLTFDYEHQALAEPPVEAPASCYRWVPDVRNGELWATGMCWTTKADGYIPAKEYRYWSPALLFDRETGRVKAILNCALTNLPATKGIDPLVAASATAKENDMDAEKEIATLRSQLATLTGERDTLAAKLAASEESDRSQLVVLGLAATAQRQERFATTSALVSLRASVFEVTGQKDAVTALGTINAWKSEAGEVAKLRADIAARADAEAVVAMDAAFEEGVKDGKLAKSPDHPVRVSLRTAVLAMGGGKPTKDGVAWLRADIAARTKTVNTEPTPGNTGGGAGGGLTEAEKTAVAAWGQNPEVAARAKANIERQKTPSAAG